MGIFKTNLSKFIHPDDDVLDRIQIEHQKGKKARILVIPDKRLSVDFNNEPGDDQTKPSFELNKFSDLTNKEFDNLFLLDENFFDEEKYPVNLNDDTDSLEGIDSVRETIQNMEKQGFAIDKKVKEKYFFEQKPDINKISKSNFTPHFSTEIHPSQNPDYFSDSDPKTSPNSPHKHFFTRNHPRMLFTDRTDISNFKTRIIPEDQFVISIDGVMIPTFVDWRQMGGKTPIKDQIKCNACYAFSALAAVEAHYKLRTGYTISLSEQEVVDCSDENKGCVGGLPHLVFNYIRGNDISYTRDYPYDQSRNSPCRVDYYNAKFQGYKVKGYMNIQKGILNLIKALSKGPIATVSYASVVFKQYRGGLYKGEGCSKKNKPNHSSLLVGYNLTGKNRYLIFKNGWGSDWGDDGYYYVKIDSLSSRNKGHCMIAGTRFNSLPRL
jgi:hypothetical protein